MNTNKSARLAKLQAMSNGLKSQFASTQTLPLAGKQMPIGDVLAGLQAEIDALVATITSRSKYEDTLSAYDAARAASLYPTLVLFVTAAAGQSSTALGEYGLTPKRTRVAATVPEKAAAVEKRRATRAARHTMGPRQKAKIQGTVAPATPAAPAPPQAATPAAPAPPPAAPPAEPTTPPAVATLTPNNKAPGA